MLNMCAIDKSSLLHDYGSVDQSIHSMQEFDAAENVLDVTTHSSAPREAGNGFAFFPRGALSDLKLERPDEKIRWRFLDDILTAVETSAEKEKALKGGFCLQMMRENVTSGSGLSTIEHDIFGAAFLVGPGAGETTGCEYASADSYLGGPRATSRCLCGQESYLSIKIGQYITRLPLQRMMAQLWLERSSVKCAQRNGQQADLIWCLKKTDGSKFYKYLHGLPPVNFQTLILYEIYLALQF